MGALSIRRIIMLIELIEMGQ